MNNIPVSKTDFIKFNVSPQFKSLAQAKAEQHGMSLSELGRMLFGAYIADIAKPNIQLDPTFVEQANQAKRAHQKRQGTLVKNKEELEDYLAQF